MVTTGSPCRVCGEFHGRVSQEQERLLTDLGISPFQVATINHELELLSNESPFPEFHAFSDGMASRLAAQGLSDDEIAVIRDEMDEATGGLAQVTQLTATDIRERDRQRKAARRAADPEAERAKNREHKRQQRARQQNTS